MTGIGHGKPGEADRTGMGRRVQEPHGQTGREEVYDTHETAFS
jgi:hypothetical protein